MSSSTIAENMPVRCLHIVYIHTYIFKAHSVRGAATFNAVDSGDTISDILQSTD